MQYAAVVCVPGDWIKSEIEGREGKKNNATCMYVCMCMCLLSSAVQSTVSVVYPRALPASQKGVCALRITCTGYVVKKGNIELSDVTVLDLPGVSYT